MFKDIIFVMDLIELSKNFRDEGTVHSFDPSKNLIESMVVKDSKVSRELKLHSVSKSDHPRKLAKMDLAAYYDIDFSRFSVIAEPIDKGNIIVFKNKDVKEKYEKLKENGTRVFERKISSLKGVPECCVKSENKRSNFDLFELAYDNSKRLKSVIKIDKDKLSPFNNTAWKKIDISFFEHSQCSLHCEESRKIAENNYKILKELGYSELADSIKNHLDKPFKWQKQGGRVIVQSDEGFLAFKSDIELIDKSVVVK